VLLPHLSEAHAAKDPEHYGRLLDWGLRLSCLLALPAALALAVLADGLIGALFEGGRFGSYDVAQSAAALRGYAAGLLGLIGVKILAPGFYARQDIRTPVRIGVTVLVGTQVANLVLVPWLSQAGLAWSISFGAFFNCALLLRGLHRRGIYSPGAQWRGFAWRIALALAGLAVAAGGASYGALLLLVGFRPRDFVLRSRQPPA
jgi:putative peptidoglycan lipid II flippase